MQAEHDSQEAEVKAEPNEYELKAEAQFHRSSTRASDLARYLGYSAIGIVWILRVTEPTTGEVVLDWPLVLVALLAMLGLAADVLQYVIGTVIWEREYVHRAERREAGSPDEQSWDDDNDSWCDKLFWAKLGCIGLCCAVLVVYLFLRLVC